MLARCKSKVLFLCVSCASFITLLSYVAFLVVSSAYNVRTRATLSDVNRNASVTTILFWNSFFSDTRWMLDADTVQLQCPRATCIFTNRRDHLASLAEFDVIVFHTARPFTLFDAWPPLRSAHQLYVFAQLESPVNSYHWLGDEASFYNLTMTYRLDSDVVWSYNRIVERESGRAVAPSLEAHWPRFNSSWTQTDGKLLTQIAGKRRLIAWLVSNCKTASRRERLVGRLRQHVPVDIYGSCGSLNCTANTSDCERLLDDYKFYLSFENSLCEDYVTEKFFNALRRRVVPVVFGGANYTRFAPPHSYIDAQAFANVAELAAYLQHLDRTPLEYAQYFWWRSSYTIDAVPLQLPYCDLCHRASSVGARFAHKTQWYEDIAAYWQHEGVCKKKARVEF